MRRRRQSRHHPHGSPRPQIRRLQNRLFLPFRRSRPANRPALLWNDQRTASQSEEIVEKAGGEARMLEMVGNLPLTGYTVPDFALRR